MNFTPEQKLILSMLCDIHEHMGINGNIDHKLVSNAITSGNSWALDWEYSGLTDPHETSNDVVKSVADTLDMWSFIEASYACLTPTDQQHVQKANYGNAPYFRGYDGNNETEFMIAAYTFVKDLDRWAEFHGRDFNSHAPSASKYQAMLDALEPIKSTANYPHLTAQQIIDLLTA